MIFFSPGQVREVEKSTDGFSALQESVAAKSRISLTEQSGDLEQPCAHNVNELITYNGGGRKAAGALLKVTPPVSSLGRRRRVLPFGTTRTRTAGFAFCLPRKGQKAAFDARYTEITSTAFAPAKGYTAKGQNFAVKASTQQSILPPAPSPPIDRPSTAGRLLRAAKCVIMRRRRRRALFRSSSK